MGSLYSVLFLSLLLGVNCGTVQRRNVGAGSSANVGHEPLLMFPAITGSTPEPTTASSVTGDNNKVTVDPRVEQLYNQLGCLNVGSSAGGDPHQLEEIEFGLGTKVVESSHLPGCFVPILSCHDKVDLVFLVDASGSVGIDNFDREKQFIISSLARFVISPNDAQTSVVMFSNQPENQFNLNSFYNTIDIIERINQIPYQAGGTYTSDALVYARDNSFSAAAGARPDARQILVIITDGRATDPKQTIQAAETLKQNNITIIAVGIGDKIDMDELRAIASDPHYILTVNDFEALRKFYGTIHELSCVFVLTTTPEPTTPEPTTPVPTTVQPTGSTEEPTTAEPSTAGPGGSVGPSGGTPKPGAGVGSSITNGPSVAPQVSNGSTASPAVTTQSIPATTSSADTGSTPKGSGTGSSVHETGNTGGQGTGNGNGAAQTNGVASTTNPTAQPGVASTGIPAAQTTGGSGGSGAGTTNALVTIDQNATPDISIDVNTTSDCEDLVNCRQYLPEKICPDNSTYRAWAEVRCKVYCGFCDPHTSPKPCIDAISNCNEYGDDLCTNPLYRLFREDNCPAFCSLCNSDVTIATPVPS